MPEAPPADPLVSRLRDPLFARAYESWLEILVERAERARARSGERRVLIPETPTIGRPTTLAG